MVAISEPLSARTQLEIARAYGIALLPFFAPKRWFTFVDTVFTWAGLLDAVGNVVMLALCVVGCR